MGHQCDQLVGTLKAGIDLGSDVCVAVQFKEKERHCGTVLLP